MTRVAIAGIGGRMGRNVATLVHEDSELTLVGGVIRPGSELTTDTIGGAVGDPAWDGCLVHNPADILSGVDVLVDFTTPDAAMLQARACLSAGTALVSGTTGLTEHDYAELRRISEKIPVFYAANLSVGVSTILEMLPNFVRALSGYDIEIMETHHSAKADSPSGTALRIAEVLREAGRGDDDHQLIFGREGVSQRQPGEIGVHAIRAGGNTGEHTILFASDDEQVEITHRSYSRLVYARGAVRAVRRIAGESSGFYTTSDLIG